jgi:hypothetical protein
MWETGGGGVPWQGEDIPPGTVPFVPNMRSLRMEQPTTNVLDLESEVKLDSAECVPETQLNCEPHDLELPHDEQLLLENAKDVTGRGLLTRIPVLEIIAVTFCCGRG